MKRAKTSSSQARSGLAPLAEVCSFIFSPLKRKGTTGHIQRLGLEVPSAPLVAEVPAENGSRESDVISLFPANSETELSNRRMRIAELDHQGESSLAIASALGIALDEVNLTLKRQGMARRRT